MQTSKTLETLSKMQGLTVQCSQVPCPENSPHHAVICAANSEQAHAVALPVQDSSVQVQAASSQARYYRLASGPSPVMKGVHHGC